MSMRSNRFGRIGHDEVRARLADKVVVITGGARGIGLETARQLLDAGARVAIGDVDNEVLAKAAALAGKGSMIPPDKTYVAWLSTYKEATRTAGARKLHGLRHGYAQARFEALAGFRAPAAGGPSRADLTPEQRAIDLTVRLQISAELGHGREEVTAVYLGR